jgi:DNA (cytosine-5)-methyltransferase 1
MKLDGIIVDNFAGGGGASTGIEAALGRAVDIAINHDEAAIRMHEVNHPDTVHIRNNIWQIDPRDVVQGRHVSLAWFSPDCKHFSKAKGGKPREKSIRDLAWVVVLWAQKVKPDLILLENVEEFRTWGPLCDQGFPIKERAGETFDQWTRALRREGYKMQWRELRACDYGAPTIRKRFFMIARRDGDPIVWPAPTHGKPDSPDVLSGKLKPWRTAAEIIDWSIPCPSIFDRKKPLAEKTLRRIAHGIMKFVVNNPSPFIVPLTHAGSDGRSYGLDDPLHTVTGANRGEMAIVAPHVTKFRSGAISHGVDEPMHTVTANSFAKRPGGAAPLGVVEAAQSPVIVGCGGRRGQSAPVGPEQPYPTTTAKADACIAAAHLVHVGNGEREGQAPRAMDVEKPLGTVVAGGIKHHAVTAFLERQFGKSEGADIAGPLPTTTAGGGGKSALVVAHIEQANGGPNNDNLAGRAADTPLSTVATTGSQQRLVTSNLLKFRGTSDAHVEASAEAVDEPLNTISAQGQHMAEVRAFLIKYYGNEQTGHGLADPLGTVTVQDRFGLVTATIDGEEYVIVDIGMRMLTPRELFNAQGFPPDYIIDRDAQGKPMTKTAQVAKCGNSVCPPLSEALVRANMAEAADQGEAAAA